MMRSGVHNDNAMMEATIDCACMAHLRLV